MGKLDLRTKEEIEYSKLTTLQRLTRGADKFAGIFWAVIAVMMIIVGFTSVNVGNEATASSGISVWTDVEKMSVALKYLYGANLQTVGIAFAVLGGLILLTLHVSGQFDKIDYRFKKIEEYHR